MKYFDSVSTFYGALLIFIPKRMCRIKPEKREAVWSMCSNIGFCIDYYSIGDGWEKLASHITQLYSDACFEYVHLTEMDWATIDVDYIAHNLSLPISDITKHKCYKLKEVHFGGQNSIMYVSPYFLYIDIPVGNKEIKIQKTDQDKSVIDFIITSKDINVMNVSNGVSCGKIEPLEKLKEFIDKDTFPDIDDKDIMSSSYIDTRKYRNCITNTQRTLRKPKNGNRYEINAFVKSEYSHENEDLFSIFLVLLVKSIDEITRIFN